MGGTVSGGVLAAATNKQKYGPDFYKRIGAKGGQNGKTGGFAANPELARKAGAIGGAKSRRSKSANPTPPEELKRRRDERNARYRERYAAHKKLVKQLLKEHREKTGQHVQT